MLTAQASPTTLRRREPFPAASKQRRLTVNPSILRPGRRHVIRAVISSGDSKAGVETADMAVESNGALVSSSRSGGVTVRAVIRIRKKMKEKLFDKIEDQWDSFLNGIGKGISLQLISQEPHLGKSDETFVRGWLPRISDNPYVVEYGADMVVPNDFGQPGAVAVTNFHEKEVFLMEIVVHGFKEPIFFTADTWIHSKKDNPESRIIFKNQAYLPSETPPGLKNLRNEELHRVRGDGKGERKMHERIYDYDVYNDLGNPDKDEELARPVVGGEERPYPRRCRTGRSPSLTDPDTESRIEKPDPVYVPRDETFEEVKQNTFSAGRLKAVLHNLIPLIVSKLASSDIPFTNFSDIDNLYNDDILLPKEAKNDHLLANLMDQVLNVGDNLLKYEIPAIIRRKHHSQQGHAFLLC